MLWLNYEGQAREVIEAKLKKSGGKPVDIDVKGRLFTRSDYYVINLPWMPGHPFGRYSYGGVAGTIAVSDIQVKESSPRR